MRFNVYLVVYSFASLLLVPLLLVHLYSLIDSSALAGHLIVMRLSERPACSVLNARAIDLT